ncbi:MAG: hypothetical protein QGG00_08535 [Verrucomicrobiota bacterium]|jgi:hypothetical protein|nr:hypothetical protein [Verrucomicrobiota bacterium]
MRFLKSLFRIIGALMVAAWIYFAFLWGMPLVQQLDLTDEWKVALFLIVMITPIILIQFLIGRGGSGYGSGGSSCGSSCGGCGGGCGG